MDKITTRPKSKEAFERAKLTLAGGVGSAIRLWPEPLVPIVAEYGKGSHVFDIDGNEYIDFLLAYGPLILGHSPQVVNEAVIAQVAKGAIYGTCCELEYTATEEIARLVPCIELVRFTSSGSEAVHNTIRLTRAYTGRDKIIKFEGHYHGVIENVGTAARYISGEPSPSTSPPGAPLKALERQGHPAKLRRPGVHPSSPVPFYVCPSAPFRGAPGQGPL